MRDPEPRYGWARLKATTVDRSQREIAAVLTHEGLDADGDIIPANGVQWGRFRKNPKMLREHDHHDDIGVWLPESLALTTIEGVPGWVAKGRLYPPGVSVSADDVYTRLQAGSMGCSIGFLVRSAEDRPGGRGKVLKEIEVLEASLVNLQSCPQCIVVAKAARIDVDVDELRHQVRETVRDQFRTIVADEVERALVRARGRIN